MPMAALVIIGVLVAGAASLRVMAPDKTQFASPYLWFPLREGLFNETPEDNRILGRGTPPQHACGFDSDCPLDYSIPDINEMAKNQRIPNQTAEQAFQKIHDEARAACHDLVKINEHGGWCYGSVDRHVQAGANSDVDYALPTHHVEADRSFVSALATHVLLTGNGSCCASLTDLGAGVGQFGHALRARAPNMEYHGYDGAGNVEEFTNNYVRFIDLTQPLNLKRTEWVISSEVGEHIPHKFEQQVIANLHAHNCKGVILTWAVLGQNGNGHINNHRNDYVIHIFQELGYSLNELMTQALRNSAGSSWWLRGSSMVFERASKPAACN